MDCVILCGGLGTRLRGILPDIPKVLAPINKVPFVDLLIEQLVDFNSISRLILATGFQAGKIQSYFLENPPSIEYVISHESEPYGTGGSLRQALSLCESEHVLVLNGDCYSDYNLSDFYQQHISTQANTTLLCPEVNNASRFGQVLIDTSSKKILSFREKGALAGRGRINGGIYLISRHFLSERNYPKNFSLEKDIFPKQATKDRSTPPFLM